MRIKPLVYKKAITLLELVIAISLLAVIALGMASVEIFSRYYLESADRVSIVQNELSYLLDYMAKIIGVGVFGGAIGDINNPPLQIGRYPGNGYILKAFVDRNRNGQRDASDFWVGFHFRDTPAEYQFWVWAPCVGPTCDGPGSKYAIISRRIKGCCQEYEGNRELSFRFAMNTNNPHAPYDPTKNYVDIRLGGCYDPFERDAPCGTVKNPILYMYTRIRMPAVSVN
ncbi:MAG: hypothetical protein NC916_02780 [Candidatus Omnitrophica bacterium]|nr:hypothetical protein [Candidatus Omnitrophota bacterium]